MDDEEAIERIRLAWPLYGDQPSQELIALLVAAIEEHPSSSELWLLYGNLLLIWDDNPGYSTQQTIAVFRKVIELDPGCWEAYQEIGFLYDTFLDESRAAETAFRTAIALGGDENCYCGLARVLAQMGRKRESIDVLSASACPYSHLPAIAKLRTDIQRDLWKP